MVPPPRARAARQRTAKTRCASSSARGRPAAARRGVGLVLPRTPFAATAPVVKTAAAPSQPSCADLPLPFVESIAWYSKITPILSYDLYRKLLLLRVLLYFVECSCWNLTYGPLRSVGKSLIYEAVTWLAHCQPYCCFFAPVEFSPPLGTL